jgi:hypothetical protein
MAIIEPIWQQVAKKFYFFAPFAFLNKPNNEHHLINGII